MRVVHGLGEAAQAVGARTEADLAAHRAGRLSSEFGRHPEP